MNFIIKEDSGLSFEINKNDLTAKVIKSDVEGNVFIPRSINYQSKDYIITQIDKNSFNYNQNIKSVKFQKNSKLRSIGEYAFSFSSIQSISIPSSVKELKYGWCSHTWNLHEISISSKSKHFSYLDENKKIIVGKSNSKIDCYDVLIFACRDIDEITIPSYITYICPFAFSGCASLQNVTFSEDSQLQSIGDFAFSFSSIRKIMIPPHVKEIGESAFTECHYLDMFDFSGDSELQSIGKNAFLSSAISSVFIPIHVNQIGESAFAECTNLKTVDFDENAELESIGKNVFSHSNIVSIQIPTNVREICEGAFSDCYYFKEIEFTKETKLKKIGKEAFNNSPINDLFIPSSVEEISDGWCSHTPDLTNLSISPKNLDFLYLNDRFLIGKTNPKSAYYDVLLFARRDIEVATIPSFIKRITSFTFSECAELKKVRFAENSELQTIGDNSFTDSSLKSLTIPSQVEVIGDYAFSNCLNLKKIKFQENSKLTTIGEYAFSTSNIQQFTFPENLRELKRGWCCYTSCLNHIEISSMNKNFAFLDEQNKIIAGKSDLNVDRFDTIVFACRDIENVFIPSNILRISSFAFYGCFNIKTLEYEDDSELKTIDKYAFSDSSIENITIPSQVDRICVGAFTKCNHLKSVHFETGVDKMVIGKNGFSQSSLKNVSVPSNICCVGQNAFSYCPRLSSAEFLGSEIQIDIFCFKCSEDFMLISFPNARKVSVDVSSFDSVSADFSLFVLYGAVKIANYDIFDMA